MRYYKHPETQKVYAYDTVEDFEQWAPAELVLMQESEVHAFLNPPMVIPVPVKVLRAQMFIVLAQADLLGELYNYVASIPNEVDAMVANVILYEAVDWSRNSPFVQEITLALDLTSDQMDDLFRTAATVEI